MSRRGRIAVTHNEFPVNHFMHLFGMGPMEAVSFLTYMGRHHVGPKAILTKFYRLPDKDDPEELLKIYDAFHSINANQQKFIDFMSAHLQKNISDKHLKVPVKNRPRKRRARKRFFGRRRRRRRWN